MAMVFHDGMKRSNHLISALASILKWILWWSLLAVVASWDHLGGEGELADEGEEFPHGT